MENNSTEKKKKTTVLVRDIFCLFIWVYAIIKLFVFDFDVYLFQKYLPEQQWLIEFKFVVLIVLISIYWLTIDNKHFFKSLLFLLVFPGYFFLWKIGKLLFRNWFAALAAISYLSSFFSSIKFNFITFTIFITSASLILASKSSGIIIIGAILASIFLLLQFGRRVYYAFIPSKALVFPKKGYATLLETFAKQYYLPEDLKNVAVEELKPEQRTKRSNNLQFLIIINRANSFVASKLKEFQDSRLLLLYFILGLLFTLVSTVVLFALVNLGLQKIDPTAFYGSSPRSFLFFIYYSFNTILTNGIADFYPISSLAKFLNALELFFGFLIIFILFFMYTNIKTEKAKEEMESVVSTLDSHSKEIEKYINQEYSIDIDNAITELEKAPGAFIKIIHYFTSKK